MATGSEESRSRRPFCRRRCWPVRKAAESMAAAVVERGGMLEEEVEKKGLVAVEGAVGGEGVEEVAERWRVGERWERGEQREEERLGEVVAVVEGAQREAHRQRARQHRLFECGREERRG